MSTQYDTRESGELIGQAAPPSKRGNHRFAGGFRPRQVAEQESAIEALKARLAEDRVTRIALKFLDAYEGVHLKDLTIDWMDDHRRMRVGDRQVINFGSDSFLGLDRDPRVQRALIESTGPWGTHNGASRAFSSVSLQEDAERRLAKWLRVPDTLIFPSVTLANTGLLPAIAGKGDLLVVDRTSHDSVQQAAKIAAQNGAILKELNPCSGDALRAILANEDYEACVVAVDGVYSMTGTIPPLDELNEVVREFGGILYVDDAHGTAVVGPGGRGATQMKLGSLDDVLMIGSLSKAFSCLGAFVTCDARLKRILKIRSSTFIFGGPVPPPYLAAICAACDIIDSPEYDALIGHLRALVARLTAGIRAIGLTALGSDAAIVSVTVGDIEQTLKAGKWLFDRGFYVQSATYPAVPVLSGLLRIQVNANHTEEDVDGLLAALADLKTEFRLNGTTVPHR
jgi:7-keto-8-aminopelargonate synthetase-like enzyme